MTIEVSHQYLYLIDDTENAERAGRKPTLRFDTRSAVSSSVNWLIWSTIVDIFEFVDDAAAVDSHLLDGALFC